MSSFRIASLVPSLTELLFSLELGEYLVARTGFCIHPRNGVRRIPKVGGTKDVDATRLLAANPSHLVVNIDENKHEQVASLRERIPHIVVTHPLCPDDNLTLYREFGRIFGRTAQANDLAARFVEERSRVAEYADGLAPRSVLYLIWKEPWFTVSPSTYVSAMLKLANLRTVPAQCDVRYPLIADDDPAWHQADAILLSTEPYAFRTKHLDELSARYQGKPILLVDGELLSWYGSRAIDGLRYLPEVRAQVDRGLSTA